MGNFSFRTVKDVLDYVKPILDCYKRFPSRKQNCIQQLRIVFDESSTAWGIVIAYNSLVSSFHSGLGKNRRRALKKLLLEIDKDHYQDVDFDCD